MLYSGNTYTARFVKPSVLVIVRSFFDPKDQCHSYASLEDQEGDGRAMSPRRFATIAAGLSGTAIVFGCVIASGFRFRFWRYQEYPRTVNRGPGYRNG